MKPGRQRFWAAQALIGGVCLILGGMVGRLVYIQAAMRPELLAYAHQRQYSDIQLPARRGTILDRRGRTLGGSQYEPTLFADPALIQSSTDAAAKLEPVLGVPAVQIVARLDEAKAKGRRFVVLKRRATRAEAEAVEALSKEEGLRGLGMLDEPARVYPMGALAAHVIGFVGADDQGLEGIEKLYDKHLSGTPGRRRVFRDVNRRPVFQEEGSCTAPKDGAHVVLTIDAYLQEVVEREVGKAVADFKAESGVGLVIDPRTGDVLAMTCVPTFEPAQAGKAPPAARRNRILTDPVEPGSVFKAYVMAPALAAGLTRPEEVIFCHNGLYVTGKRMLHDHHPYGNLTVEQILTKSSNIGMAILGQRLGNTRIYEALKAFGFGRASGIDLPGEDNGLLMPLKTWTSFTTTSVPMGHELAVTPMQLATAFSALANGGLVVQPRVVRAVLDADGEVIEEHREPTIRGTAVDAQTAATMRRILVKVVEEGTGTVCRLDRWWVMGKTGTAQVPRIQKGRRGYEPDTYLGSFIAAAPASDPMFVTLVMIRKPDRRIGYYGSKVAAPAVKVILEEALRYFDVPPDKDESDRTRQQLVWDTGGD